MLLAEAAERESQDEARNEAGADNQLAASLNGEHGEPLPESSRLSLMSEQLYEKISLKNFTESNPAKLATGDSLLDER